MSGARATAVVRGTMPYAVELWVGSSGETGWSCTCPVAEDGRFCKHAVAVALTATDNVSPNATESDGDRRTERTAPQEPDELRAYVAGLDSERLVDLVVEAASGDWRLRERLVAEAATATGAGQDITAWRRRLEDAFSVGDFEDDYVRYREAEGWAEDVRGARRARGAARRRMERRRGRAVGTCTPTRRTLHRLGGRLGRLPR